MNFYQNSPSVAKQISTLLYKKYPNKKSKTQEQRQEILKCMDTHGYLIQVEENEENDENEELYEHMLKNDSSSDEEEEPTPNFEQEFIQSLAEREQSSVSGPFAQRTSIQGNERLSNINIRGVSSEEQDYTDVQEQINSVLNKLNIDNNAIKTYAMDMYLRIREFYKTSNEIKGEIKGSVRRGYILLILYYSLINFSMCISRPDLAVYFSISLSDLPKADKNIKMIFGNLDDNELCLCNMRGLFDNTTLQRIKNKIEELKELGKIDNPATLVQIAAVIHYITKTDYNTIKNYCGISPDTIRKTVFKLNLF
jgi:hypothetical protein